MSPAIRRNAGPSTLTSGGRVCSTYTPGDADKLRGPARFAEVYRRLRRRFGPRSALRMAWAAWRFGVVLSGDRTDRPRRLPAVVGRWR